VLRLNLANGVAVVRATRPLEANHSDAGAPCDDDDSTAAGGAHEQSPYGLEMGVKDWNSANQRSATGIVSVGTNPLPRSGREINGMGILLAVSTLFALREVCSCVKPMAATDQANCRTYGNSDLLHR
jgi:hypothetical protein